MAKALWQSIFLVLRKCTVSKSDTIDCGNNDNNNDNNDYNVSYTANNAHSDNHASKAYQMLSENIKILIRLDHELELCKPAFAAHRKAAQLAAAAV